MLFLLGALSSAFVWPWLFLLLRQLRRDFDVR
jgi:rod shape-determining protein MreD